MQEYFYALADAITALTARAMNSTPVPFEARTLTSCASTAAPFARLGLWRSAFLHSTSSVASGMLPQNVALSGDLDSDRARLSQLLIGAAGAAPVSP